MITGEIKSKVDRIWDTLWSGGISNPLTIIEQLTYLLFIKRLNEIHTLKENKASRLKKPIEEPIFTPKQNNLCWSRFKESSPEEMFTTVRDKAFPFIKDLGKSISGEGGSTYSHHMKDATFMMPTSRVLANMVDQLDSIDMADSDTKGDLYEYMLGKIASAQQIRFVELVIDQLTARGFMEPAALYEAPFSSIHADGPEGLFAGKPNIIDGLFHTLEETLPKVMEG